MWKDTNDLQDKRYDGFSKNFLHSSFKPNSSECKNTQK